MKNTKRRVTIGNDPFDSVIPMNGGRHPQAKSAEIEVADERIGKERLTVHLPLDLINRVKNAVYWTPGLTLAGLAEEAFIDTMKRLERDRGSCFPQRKSELKGGRPLK